MPAKTAPARTVAEAWLALLRARGVDYFFANAGTDFASLVEAYAGAEASGLDLPTPVVVPHENAAVGMAHGYYLMTGRAQAAMVHVNVGTANALTGVMNASREQVPLLLAAGRNPILEHGAPGARSMHIHWAQEMFDQAGIVREMVRWDYELRDPRQLETVIDRALSLASGHPRGPVYLSLPREVMAQPMAGFTFAEPSRLSPTAPPAPNAEAVAEAAEALAAARNPLIITARLGSEPEAVDRLARLAEHYALPVVEFRPRYLNLPGDHPMHGGYDTAPWLDDADCILVLDSDVPWFPDACAPRAECPVIQIGPDPAFARYPIRGFASDITITSDFSSAIEALDEALSKRLSPVEPELAKRRARIADHRAAITGAEQAKIAVDRTASPMGRHWISRCVAEALDEDSIVVNEYPFMPDAARLTRPRSYFFSPSVSGLGWGFPTALGVKLAAGERLVVATLGDGAYLFANPLVCHQVARVQKLPILTVVFNNSAWEAVREATQSMYPEGHATRANRMPLTAIDDPPAYEEVVATCGGYGERVDDPEELPAALARAKRIVKEEGRQALLNVICS